MHVDVITMTIWCSDETLHFQLLAPKAVSSSAVQGVSSEAVCMEEAGCTACPLHQQMLPAFITLQGDMTMAVQRDIAYQDKLCMVGQGSYLQFSIFFMSSLSSCGVHTFLCCRVQQGSSEAERALLECSLISLQAIQQAVGADSAQYRAASKVTMKLVQIVQTLLSNAYDGR